MSQLWTHSPEVCVSTRRPQEAICAKRRQEHRKGKRKPDTSQMTNQKRGLGKQPEKEEKPRKKRSFKPKVKCYKEASWATTEEKTKKAGFRP